MVTQTESPPRPSPISPGWLWALRVLTVLVAVLQWIPFIKFDLDVIQMYLPYLPFLVGYGLVLWYLRTNPPGKLGLAVALGMGGIMFVMLLLLSLLSLSQLMQRSWDAVSMMAVLAITLPYPACAMRVYYLLPRQKHDRRTLFGGLALVGLLYVFA